jgi:hypothetical protein
MKWVSISALTLWLLTTPAVSALAASAKVSGGYEGCDRPGEGADCTFSLEIDGEIDSTTVDKVKELFAVRHPHLDSYRLSGIWERFSINSFGGNVATALEIGRIFRKERAWLAVDRNDDCISACVFVLAGAVDRFVWGRVGIHRPYSMRIDPSWSADKVKDTYRATLQQIRSYLREMNVSERLADDMLAVEPEKVRFLTKAELTDYGLLGVDRDERETRAIENEIHDVQEASRLGLDRLEYTRRKALGEAQCPASPLEENEACMLRILKTGQ